MSVKVVDHYADFYLIEELSEEFDKGFFFEVMHEQTGMCYVETSGLKGLA